MLSLTSTSGEFFWGCEKGMGKAEGEGEAEQEVGPVVVSTTRFYPLSGTQYDPQNTLCILENSVP